VDFERRCRELWPVFARTAHELAFHVDAPSAPNVLSSWTSAHVALALAPQDPTAATAELRALYRACQRADGLVAGERAGDAKARAERQAAVGPLFGEDERSILIAPPVAAYAAARLARAQGAQVRDLLECATRELDAIWGQRLPPDTPLPVILHPLESGCARSALYDELVEQDSDESWRDESATLLRSAAACQLDPERALRAGHAFVIEDPVFCGWLLLALEACSQAWEKLGDTTVCLKLRIRSEMIAEGVASRLWWDEQDLYAAWNRGRQSALRAVTAGGLLPAAARSLLEEGTPKRAVDRHLRPGVSPLWVAQGLSQRPIQRDERQPLAAGSAAISPLAHFWAHLVLVRADRTADARVARAALESLALARGFHAEYAATDEDTVRTPDDSFWPALALEMRSRETEL
jgi:mannosylglycerate hydrolase MGH1-like protein